MVTDRERRFVWLMCKVGIWQAQISLFRQPIIFAKRFEWLLEWLMRRQIVDKLHHAPRCPANHFHKRRLVFQPCTCGAPAQERAQQVQHSGDDHG